MINHRYHIVKKLGEGGSGEVFLVEDTLIERRQSAMKILHHEGLADDSAGDRFRSEVSILASLHHPNLVRVYDFGVVRQTDDDALQGRRFMTMEYIRGVTAEDWCRGLPTDEIRAIHLSHLLLQALEVLAYVHRQGIIHFDIKPDNLMLISGSESGHVLPLLKLMDFGFSITREAARDFSLRGTLEYTAPELLRRDPFDHRIDLYSLGVTLYQLIEDRCPFEADDPVELIKKVLTTEPEFLRSRETSYIPFLPLLTRLLQKDPTDRFSSAEESGRAIPALDEGTPATPVDHVARPGFVGRESEKKQIIAAIVSLATGHPDTPEVAMLISGPEGIGKTALLDEMVRHARASDVPVLEASTFQRDVPFGTVLSLLPLLRAEVLSRSGHGGDLTKKFATVIDAPGGEVKERHTAWIHERDNTIAAQARFINQASLLFPLMLVVDNVDLADHESLEVLKLVIRGGTVGRLFVLLTERNESGLSLVATQVPLGELPSDCVAAMTTSILSPLSVGEAIGRRLYQLYGGTPAIIVEALSSLDTLLRTGERGVDRDPLDLAAQVIGQLPRTLDQLLFLRYQSLDREHQLTLDILSCFRGSARLGLVQALLPFQRQRTSAYLSSLEALGSITSHDGGQRWSIRQNKLRSMVGRTIWEDRQEVHLFIASTMEHFPGARSFADLQELAHQFTEGGQFTAGRRWLEAAADEGMRLAAYPRAGELYRQALDMSTPAEVADAGQLTVKLAQSLFHGGAFREAIDLATTTLGNDLTDEGHHEALHKIAGFAQSRLGEYEDARKHINAALESCTDVRENVELAQGIVEIDIALGNYRAAEQASIDQLVRVKDLGDRRIIASISLHLGIATFLQDLFDRSAGYFQEAMEIYLALGQETRVADAMMNIGNVMSAKGDTTHAVEYWRKALAIAQEHGTLNQQAQIQNNLGIAHYKLKQFEEARHFYDNAKALFRLLESKQGGAYVLTNLGEVAFAEGDYERAMTLWNDALTSYRDMDDGRGIVETLMQLAQVRLVLGDDESVAGYLDAAEALTNEKELETLRSQLFSLQGLHAMALGHYDGARTFFKMSEGCIPESEEGTHRLLLRVRMAECDHHMDNAAAAAASAREAIERGESEYHPQVVAEGCLLMGKIARSSPSTVPDKPLFWFRKGFDAIVKEPVAEITWKLALALGQEFAERGQREKAKEYLTRAKLVLQFFAGRFLSAGLKDQYLAVEKKSETLAGLEKFLRT